MKKILVFALALMLVLSLAACGDSGKAPTVSNDTPDIQNPTPNSIDNGGASANAENAENAEIENKVDMSLDKSTYEIGEHIAVTLDFSKLNQGAAVIVVVNSDTAHGKAIPYDDDKAWTEYRWLSDFSETPFYLYPQNTGSGLYDVRVYADAESGEELASITIAVGNATLPTESANADNTGTGNTPDDGGETKIGGEWPDNEYTKLIPKPSFDFSLDGAGTGEDAFTVVFTSATFEQIRDYAAEIKSAGFSVDEDVYESGTAIYNYMAANSDGYKVEIAFANGISTLSISKP